MNAPSQVVRFLVQATWRRRWLLILPVLLMLPVGFATSKLMPSKYITHSLLLLQESGQPSPLAREPANEQFISKEERLAALRALLLSERVLGGVLDDLGVKPARERAMRLRDLRQNLWLEGAGTNFIEIYHSGPNAGDLGENLKNVISRLLEALVPEKDGPDAIQILLEKHTHDLEAARARKAEIEKQRAELSIDDPAMSQAKLAELHHQSEAIAKKLRAADQTLQTSNFAVDFDPENVQRYEQEIDRLASANESNQGSANSSLRPEDLATLREAFASRKAALAEQEKITAAIQLEQAKISDYGRLKTQIANSDREIAHAQALVEATRKRLESIPVTGGTGILRAPELIRIIDPPKDPEFPARSPTIYLFAALAAGALIGLFLASVAEVFDTSLREIDEFSEISGADVVTRIGPKQPFRRTFGSA